MRRKLLLVLLVIFTGSAKAVLPFESKSTTFERGPYSFGIGAHHSTSEVVFSDGAFTDYKGFTYSAYLDVQLWGRPDNGDVRLFAMLLNGKTKNERTDGDALSRNETLLGLKVYASPKFYIGAGLGNESLRRSDSAGDSEYSNAISVLTLGFDVPLSMNVFFSLQGWFKQGIMKRNQNDALRTVGNVNFASTELALVLIWSPSFTYATPK